MTVKRLAWCQERRDWTYDEWKLFIFNDKCSMKWDTDKRQEWMFHTSNEKWIKEMIQSYKKRHNVNVMIWIVFHDKNKSKLIKLNCHFKKKKKNYFANSYNEVFNEHLLKIYQSNITFQQNNALIHTTKKIKTWFENKDVKTTNWFLYLFDLNCIKHIVESLLWVNMRSWCWACE